MAQEIDLWDTHIHTTHACIHTCTDINIHMHTSMHTITQAYHACTDIYTHRNTQTQIQMKPSPVYSLTILLQ